MTSLNGTWQLVSGSDLDQANTKVGEYSFKARKYGNSQQAGAAAGGVGFIPS